MNENKKKQNQQKKQKNTLPFFLVSFHK